MTSVFASIDFDGTFTADPELWRAFAASARARGHLVILVTQRCEQFRGDVEAVVGDMSIFDHVLFANGKSKEGAAREAGLEVGIWIDDSPYSVSTALRYHGCPEA